MASVVVEEKGGGQVLRVELRGPSMGIGRDESNDIRLENRALSRKHAQLEMRGASIWIRDLGSQNGTFINGERLDGAKAIQSGDVISLGGKFQLRLEGVEEAKTSTPVLTLTGPEGSHRFAMVGEEIVIGRSPDCDISIGRKSISRRHLRVLLKDGKFLVEDLGSQNGTRVNAEKIRGLTPIGPEDDIRISEYTLKVSYLEQEAGAEEGAPAAGAPAKPGTRSMLLDKSKLSGGAADMGGDFEVQVTHENRLAFGADQSKGAAGGDPAQAHVDWQDGDERAETVGQASPMTPKAPPPLKPPALPRHPPAGRPVPGAAAKAAASRGGTDPVLEVAHADGASRTVKLKREVTFVAEDGSDSPPTEGVSYAPQGYLLFAPTAQGWMVTVVGDRRLVQVAGRASVAHILQDGDVASLGGLQVTFRASG